jgi:hypothetical protein
VLRFATETEQHSVDLTLANTFLCPRFRRGLSPGRYASTTCGYGCFYALDFGWGILTADGDLGDRGQGHVSMPSISGGDSYRPTTTGTRSRCTSFYALDFGRGFSRLCDSDLSELREYEALRAPRCSAAFVTSLWTCQGTDLGSELRASAPWGQGEDLGARVLNVLVFSCTSPWSPIGACSVSADQELCRRVALVAPNP